MISSGDSILDVARELKRRKARKVYAAATFGLFTNGLAKFDAAYEQGIIDHILTTNLVLPETRAAISSVLCKCCPEQVYCTFD